jgi:RHS repeat-associated protein
MPTMSARYTVIDGEVIAQERSGVRHQLVPDPLGSTVALYNDAGTKTDTFQYWPYGESAARTGTTVAKFQYVGAYGYYTDSSSRNYVRARYLSSSKGRWITEDRDMSNESLINLYRYAFLSPAIYFDFNGLYPQKTSGTKKHPCQDRTEDYCDGARENKCSGRAENCFCKASTLICKYYIINPTNPNRVKMDCINRCMYNNWKKKGGGFPHANDVCKQFGDGSSECCQAQVQAEQDGLTYCRDVACKNIGGSVVPNLILLDPRAPIEKRVEQGTQACCKGGFGDPVPREYPVWKVQ